MGAAFGAARGAYGAWRSAPRGYGDLPSAAGETLTQLLRAAGVNQAGGGNSDTWNAVLQGVTQSFLAQYDTVTIATNATPPITVNLRDALAKGPPSPIAQWLQPTVVLTGAGGQQMIAPYGASAGSHGGPILLVLGLVGFGFILGRLT